MAGDLGDPVRELSRVIEGIPKAALAEAVKTVQTIAGDEAGRDTGGDGRLSHMGNVPVTLADTYREGADQSTVSMFPSTRGTAGAWGLLEGGAVPHEIGGARTVGRGRNRTVRGRRLLTIGGRVVTGPVQHPGARAKHTFTRVLTRAHVEVPAVAERTLDSELSRAGW